MPYRKEELDGHDESCDFCGHCQNSSIKSTQEITNDASCFDIMCGHCHQPFCRPVRHWDEDEFRPSTLAFHSLETLAKAFEKKFYDAFCEEDDPWASIPRLFFAPENTHRWKKIRHCPDRACRVPCCQRMSYSFNGGFCKQHPNSKNEAEKEANTKPAAKPCEPRSSKRRKTAKKRQELCVLVRYRSDAKRTFTRLAARRRKSKYDSNTLEDLLHYVNSNYAGARPRKSFCRLALYILAKDARQQVLEHFQQIHLPSDLEALMLSFVGALFGSQIGKRFVVRALHDARPRND